MQQEPKSLQPRSRFKVLTSLWKGIDEKTDRLLPLLELLEWMKKGPSDLGKQFLNALSTLNEELNLHRDLRLRQEEALKQSIEKQADLTEELEALAKQTQEIDEKLDKLMKIMQVPMK